MKSRPSPARLANVTMRQLRAFAAVAGQGSIRRAADQLHVTPSALSMLISGIEAELGVRLFERTSRRVELTDAGQALRPTVEAVFGQLESAFEDLHRAHERRLGQVTIAASPLLAATLLPEVLVRFRDREPGIRVVLRDLPVGDIADAVRDGRADLGLCTGDTDTRDLAVQVLQRDRFLLACPVDHPLARQGQVRWRALVGEPLILMQPGGGLRRLVDEAFAGLGEAVQPAFEVGHVATASALAEAGLGLAPLPAFTLRRVAAGRLVLRPLIEPTVERDLVILRPPGREISPAVDALAEEIGQVVDGVMGEG